MMMRARVSAVCWGAVALLHALGCRHEPDVVANISQIEAEDPGSSPAGSGAGSSAAGNGGTSGGGSGGMAGTSVGPVGSGRAGSSANSQGGNGSGAGGASGNDASSGRGGDTGPSVMGTGGTIAIEACEFFYRGVAEVVEDECVIEPDINFGVLGFVLALPVEIPMTESQPFSWCQFAGVKVYRDGMEWILCDDVCDAARKWLAARERMHGCPMGAPDAPAAADDGEPSGGGGVDGGAADAGSDS